MWKLHRSRVLLDEAPEEEDGPRGGSPPAAAAAAAQGEMYDNHRSRRRLRNSVSSFSHHSNNEAKVQGASFRGWKEVSSLFNKDDEQHLLERCKSPKSKGTNLRLKEELKTEKKAGFWDNLVLKPSAQSKKPDEIEGWEPPKLGFEDVAVDVDGAVSDCPPQLGWEEDGKASTKYTSLAGSGNSSRWGLRSAGKLVGLRRPSKGHLTDSWEGLE